ncbi:class II fructose-bisphosphate aldolase [Rhodohalobacter sulfatireducens]|uniref:Class II fructose-bisphosphate aldolase n=1 Tax=Rhodohalobacter sulfatireducens TaxID=2911366 RepID=A0ABS9K9F6_9BACT|nr:class II fructose-bisphosphate aldolase [Rhodohalobacter sulfatireducens]MCG2587471.1 class II fructose-bisphosphate aldolase [Rhodohalobacter sulfatireducens]
MPLILDRADVLDVYDYTRQKKWVLPTFNSENLTTTEAILSAVSEYGEFIGINNLPIIVGITNTYKDRPQAVYYTHTKRWDIGLKLFLQDLKVLTDKGSAFEHLRVMVHLDHIIWDEDRDLLGWDMSQFSSIMYDASTLPFEENIRKTAAFVEQFGQEIVIEGACDEIQKSGGMNDPLGLTTPEVAVRYQNETGIDILVPNLGTEHRSKKSTLKYHGESARQISNQIGKVLCLHGSSSVSKKHLANLYEDGICKVNMWTALERESTKALFEEMVKNSAKVVGPEMTKTLIADKILAEPVDFQDTQSIKYFTTLYRQEIIFRKMKEIITHYLKLWYR